MHANSSHVLYESISHVVAFRRHAYGMVHRDVKPANILVANNGAVKLADMGLAKPIAELEASSAGHVLATHTRLVAVDLRELAEFSDFLLLGCGTLVYCAPERLLSQPYSCRSDVWSLGVTLMALNILLTAIFAFESIVKVCEDDRSPIRDAGHLARHLTSLPAARARARASLCVRAARRVRPKALPR